MANIVGSTITQTDKTIQATWALGNADTGLATKISRWTERTVQIGGTFGGATVVIEGSNDGVTYSTLNDTSATPVALSFTAAGLKKILENPVFIRAKTSGGSGSAVVVIINGTNGQGA